MANLFDTKYLQYKTIKVIPNHIFNTIFYVEDAHNGALKQVKLIRVEHNLASGKRFYVVKTPLGEMKAQSLILYSTIDDWQNNNIAYYLEKWGGVNMNTLLMILSIKWQNEIFVLHKQICMARI